MWLIHYFIIQRMSVWRPTQIVDRSSAFRFSVVCSLWIVFYWLPQQQEPTTYCSQKLKSHSKSRSGSDRSFMCVSLNDTQNKPPVEVQASHSRTFLQLRSSLGTRLDSSLLQTDVVLRMGATYAVHHQMLQTSVIRQLTFRQTRFQLEECQEAVQSMK